jgi:hypothetical protein
MYIIITVVRLLSGYILIHSKINYNIKYYLGLPIK